MTIGYKTGGRKVGTPNKSTAESKRLINEFLDRNCHRLTELLNNVANGIPRLDPKTGIATSEYLVKPNPSKAFDMLISAIEFQLPKAARSTMVVTDIPDHESFSVFHDLLESMKNERQNSSN